MDEDEEDNPQDCPHPEILVTLEVKSEWQVTVRDDRTDGEAYCTEETEVWAREGSCEECGETFLYNDETERIIQIFDAAVRAVEDKLNYRPDMRGGEE